MSFRWFLRGVLVLLCIGVWAEDARPDELLSWRFVGARKWIGSASGGPWAKVVASPRMAPVSERFALRVAEWMALRLGRAADPHLVPALQPVVADLLRRESAGCIGASGWWVAVRADPACADLWREALPVLEPVLPAEGGTAPRIRVLQTNEWLIATGGAVSAGEWSAALARPGSAMLDARVNLVQWGAGKEAPRLELTGGTTNGMVRWDADFRFPGEAIGPLEPWRYPTNQIREPLIMFSAVRGMRPLLSRIPWVAEVFGRDLPNQAVAWSQAKVPFRNWLAMPVPDDSRVVRRIHDALLPWFGADAGEQRAVMGRLGLATNELAAAILLGDRLEAIAPAVGLLRDGGQTYLQASLFSPEPSTNRIPAALRQQLAQDSLAAYQFELTGETLRNLNAAVQLGRIVLGYRPAATNAVAQPWLMGMVDQLGESITRVEATSASLLHVERRSPLGLNAVELLALGRWLDGDPGRPAVRPGSLLPAGKER